MIPDLRHDAANVARHLDEPVRHVEESVETLGDDAGDPVGQLLMAHGIPTTVSVSASAATSLPTAPVSVLARLTAYSTLLLAIPNSQSLANFALLTDSSTAAF